MALKQMNKIVVVSLVALAFQLPLYGINLQTIRPTKVTMTEKGFMGLTGVPAGTLFDVANYDSNLPNQVVLFRGKKHTVPTIDLEPGPITPPEVLDAPNADREIVCSDMGALRGFYAATNSDPVGIIYCANDFGRNAGRKRSNVLDAIALNPNIGRTKIVVVMETERISPATNSQPGFYLNGEFSGAQVTSKAALKEYMSKNTVVIFRNNPANAISYLLKSGVKHILFISSFADPADPGAIEPFRASFAQSKITFSVLSSPATRVADLLMSEISPIMLVSFKPDDSVCTLVKETGGTIYLNNSAREKQPAKIAEIVLPPVR